MPEGTLGRDVGIFLKRHNLEVIPMAEFHDVYHVLFNYGTTIKDEACIQFVPLGNGRWSLPYVACTFVSAAFYPEYWKDFYRAFCTGKNANKFHDWDFQELLGAETEKIRRMIFEKE
ncbi:MAG: Coq4 family protein [Bacteroidia bacterium]